jgi:NAD+ diphosphatase
LNRLSFLRTEHPFLSAALKHPSARFLLLKELSPLTRSPGELFWAHYKDVQKLVPPTIYDKQEEDMIREYDSRITLPQLIFLGLDESAKDGTMEFKIYKGRPYFALDVTPRGNEEQQAHAKELVESMEAKGLAFLGARIHMTLPAEQGEKKYQSSIFVPY